MQDRRSGFTLLELLSVMVIMAVVMAAGVASFYGMGKGARMRGAVNVIRQSVSLARQQAILKGQTLRLEFTSRPGGKYSFQVWNKTADDPDDYYKVGQARYLPLGIRISPADTVITFYPTGSTGGSGTTDFTLTQADGQQNPVDLTVYNLTGLMRVVD